MLRINLFHLSVVSGRGGWGSGRERWDASVDENSVYEAEPTQS